MQTGQTDPATFVGWVREGRTRKFSAIQVETTKWSPCWWVVDIPHLERRREDEEGPRVGIESDANGTNGPCHLRWMGPRGTHAKIQRHRNRGDGMDTPQVDRRHPAPGATKRGPGGTATRGQSVGNATYTERNHLSITQEGRKPTLSSVDISAPKWTRS
eukprot:scaffold1012_cov278-Pavlova_lutheri.AAC.1